MFPPNFVFEVMFPFVLDPRPLSCVSKLWHKQLSLPHIRQLFFPPVFVHAGSHPIDLTITSFAVHNDHVYHVQGPHIYQWDCFTKDCRRFATIPGMGDCMGISSNHEKLFVMYNVAHQVPMNYVLYSHAFSDGKITQWRTGCFFMITANQEICAVANQHRCVMYTTDGLFVRRFTLGHPLTPICIRLDKDLLYVLWHNSSDWTSKIETYNMLGIFLSSLPLDCLAQGLCIHPRFIYVLTMMKLHVFRRDGILVQTLPMGSAMTHIELTSKQLWFLDRKDNHSISWFSIEPRKSGKET